MLVLRADTVEPDRPLPTGLDTSTASRARWEADQPLLRVTASKQQSRKRPRPHRRYHMGSKYFSRTMDRYVGTVSFQRSVVLRSSCTSSKYSVTIPMNMFRSTRNTMPT